MSYTTGGKYMRTGSILFLILFTGLGLVYGQSTNTIGNQNQLTNNNTDNERNITIANPAIPAHSIIGSPTAFAHSGYYNSPWNFTPPSLLFDASKTINDHSAFHKCRLVNLSTGIRDSLRDRIMGVFDEKEFISTGVGKLRGKVPDGPGQVIVCDLQTKVPPSCVRFIGTGYVYMNEYASTEAALVGISRLASNKGANLVGNLNCPYQENISASSTSVGAGVSGHGHDDAWTLGASHSRAKTTRTVQPHCSADFYVVNGNCRRTTDPFSPRPRHYRRYLPAQKGQQVAGFGNYSPNNPYQHYPKHQNVPGKW